MTKLHPVRDGYHADALHPGRDQLTVNELIGILRRNCHGDEKVSVCVDGGNLMHITDSRVLAADRVLVLGIVDGINAFYKGAA